VQRIDPGFPRSQTWHSRAEKSGEVCKDEESALLVVSDRARSRSPRYRHHAELRKLHPDLQVDWLAQDPVTRLLETSGERVHPLSSRLASETLHIELESGEHDLNAFQAIRRMDEVLIKNFMIFQEAVEEGGYDLVIADEAWDIDHYWHEHPDLKKAKLAWFTDFVGYVPMPANGAHEAFLTTDYNGEMIGHVERHPGVRDRAIFVGSPEDIVPLSFGMDLPSMREWVPKHFDFAGYIIGEHPRAFGSRDDLRRSLGYQPGRVRMHCYWSADQASVRISSDAFCRAFPLVRSRIPELRMILVAGPRSILVRLMRRPVSRSMPSYRISIGIWRLAIWHLCRAV
jgi:hypothetical protein